MPEDDKDKPRKKRGWARAVELRAVRDDERKQLEASILANLGRDPIGVDRISAEAVASAVINMRRKQAAGQDDSGELRLLAQVLRATGLTSLPPAGPGEQTSNPIPIVISQNQSLY
jgi:hypothetical protein